MENKFTILTNLVSCSVAFCVADAFNYRATDVLAESVLVFPFVHVFRLYNTQEIGNWVADTSRDRLKG